MAAQLRVSLIRPGDREDALLRLPGGFDFAAVTIWLL
jgi:hypothetical protein